jgi:curli biogenesis system outer membrane secretion channel CsgG
MAVGVGEVRDFTGKSSINEGATITQGGSLMVMSALGKLGRSVRLHERFDPRVGELELIYADRRQLGDGRTYTVPDGQRLRQVPWLPYMGGSILQSQYFIVGGITEVNWAIQSGGFSARVNGVGPRARSFTMSIAADLRIVDTRTLVVAHTVSLQKQVVGHEIDADVFRFFGDRLFDVNVGTRNLEPVQMAVRATLELGVLELMSYVSGVTLEGCLEEAIRAGFVSRGYAPPALPAPPEPVPVAEAPAAPPPAQPRPRRTAATRPPQPACASNDAPPSLRCIPPGEAMPTGPAAPARVAAPDPAQPLTPQAAQGARQRPIQPVSTTPNRRPDSETRPPIPTWLEGPSLPSASPGSLFGPGGGAPLTPVQLPSPSAPAPAPVPLHMQDGNAPSGGPLNVLGSLVPAATGPVITLAAVLRPSGWSGLPG